MVRAFRTANHRLPIWSDLALTDNITVDPWGHDYLLAAGPARASMTIRSCGPDGVENTDDDITAVAR